MKDINKLSGIHGLGDSIGRPLQGRFCVIRVENLRAYTGDFVASDPDRRLDIAKPKLLNGEIPSGFLGFAVNMIKVDSKHLYCLSPSRCGIRETLFHNLFSRLRVYRTRSDMVLALPCVSDGAISLDGGMIRSSGIFSLGSRDDVYLQFPKSIVGYPMDYVEIEKQMKKMQWERERLKEETRRAEEMLNQANLDFQKKKQEFVKFLADSSKYLSQQHMSLIVADWRFVHQLQLSCIWANLLS